MTTVEWFMVYVLAVLIGFLFICHLEREDGTPVQEWDISKWIRNIACSLAIVIPWVIMIWVSFAWIYVMVLTEVWDFLIKERKLLK